MGQVLFYFSRSRSNTEIFSYIKKIGCKKNFLEEISEAEKRIFTKYFVVCEIF